MDRRLKVLEAPEREGITVRRACREAGISPTTYYDWKLRLEAGGALNLAPRSRRPWSSPTRIDALLEERICQLRDEHGDWGPVRIHGELHRMGHVPPSISTIRRVLARNGLVGSRLQRPPPPAPVRFERASPNELWQTDATEFRLADGTTASVLNVLDDCARMLLASRAVTTADANAAWTTMNAAIAAHGRPREVLSDNGSYFTGRLYDAVALFERRLWAAGVATTHSRPHHPQTCGKQERMHSTQKHWLDQHGPFHNLAELQAGLDAFTEHYNHERPHQALGNLTPATRFGELPHAGPEPGLVAPRQGRRRVDGVGKLSYGGWQVHVGAHLAGGTVEVTDDGAKIRIFHDGVQLHAFVADEPKGYISSGRPPGRPPKPA